MDTSTQNNLLHFLPPPIQRWRDELFEKRDISVDVLRLDLIHPIIGGNKWMKLKGFLQQALQQDRAGILTKGGPWSNHIHACAWLCNRLNLPCQVWVKGKPQFQTPMLQDVSQWNANLSYINRRDFYNEQKAAYFAEENNLLYIPMGGAEETGVMQVTTFMQHLHLPLYDYAVCAVGTATTLGGLCLMPYNFKHVIGVDSGTNDAAVKEKIMHWQKQSPHKTLQLLEDYCFGGFARYTSELIHFMNEIFEAQHIPTDVVYTGKLFFAVKAMAAKNIFPAGAKLLIVHSGGLQGNRSLPAGLLQF